MAKNVYLKTCNNFLNVKNILNTSKKLKAKLSQTSLPKDTINKYNNFLFNNSLIANQKDKKNIKTFKKIQFNINSKFIYV